VFDHPILVIAVVGHLVAVVVVSLGSVLLQRGKVVG